MEKTRDFVFFLVKAIVWIVFVGLCIKAGIMLFQILRSLVETGSPLPLPETDPDDPESRNPQMLLWFSFVLTSLKALLFYKGIQLTSKLNFQRPFTEDVARTILGISHVTLLIGVFSYISKRTFDHFFRLGIQMDLSNPLDGESQAFLMMAAVVYLIGIIFQKGVEIQSENDLTV